MTATCRTLWFAAVSIFAALALVACCLLAGYAAPAQQLAQSGTHIVARLRGSQPARRLLNQDGLANPTEGAAVVTSQNQGFVAPGAAAVTSQNQGLVVPGVVAGTSQTQGVVAPGAAAGTPQTQGLAGPGAAAGTSQTQGIAGPGTAAGSPWEEQRGAGGGRGRTPGELGEAGGLVDALLRLRLGLAFMLLIPSLILQYYSYTRSRGSPHDLDQGLEADMSGRDIYGSELALRQVFRAIECFGIEAANSYITETDGRIFIDERSDPLQRICCSVNRELTLFVHAGPSAQAPVALKLYKPFHLQGGNCFCRPQMLVTLGNGQPVGQIEDPWKCCAIDQKVFNSHGHMRYQVEGSVCQPGAFCPLCADMRFEVYDASAMPVGQIVKPKITFGQGLGHTNRFIVSYPRQCTMEDKQLLTGATMLLDLQYFEVNKKK